MSSIVPKKPAFSRASIERRARAEEAPAPPGAAAPRPAPESPAPPSPASALPHLPPAELERQLGQRPARRAPLPAGPAGQGPVHLLLQARTGARMPVVPALHVTDSPAGRVAKGDLAVLHRMDLEALRGVTVLKGDLTLAETSLKPFDLSALASLEVVTGRLALEGNLALSGTEALSALRSVGKGLYVGFNDGLERLHLPSLEEAGALIVEDNPALVELSLPALGKVARYLHVEGNPRLARMELDLTRLACEQSFVGNAA